MSPIVSQGNREVKRAWRRYHDFMHLMKLGDVAIHKPNTAEAAKAWTSVTAHQRWFNAFQVEYLLMQHHLMEIFLEKVLHAVDDSQLLFQFVDEDSWVLLRPWYWKTPCRCLIHESQKPVENHPKDPTACDLYSDDNLSNLAEDVGLIGGDGEAKAVTVFA